MSEVFDAERVAKVVQKMDAKLAQLSAEEKDIKAQKELLLGSVQAEADKMGVTSLKTQYGTFYLSETSRFSMADDNTFVEFVKRTGEIGLMERRVAAGNVKQYMEDHNGEIPPGLNWFKESTMKLRKSTK